ncbi:hypothetical protein AHF37_01228 [Paragonimus kellicotti]|nr:hypothetical protein AHF37_01228 [Paragonimus kellicotti]
MNIVEFVVSLLCNLWITNATVNSSGLVLLVYYQNILSDHFCAEVLSPVGWNEYPRLPLINVIDSANLEVNTTDHFSPAYMLVRSIQLESSAFSSSVHAVVNKDDPNNTITIPRLFERNPRAIVLLLDGSSFDQLIKLSPGATAELKPDIVLRSSTYLSVIATCLIHFCAVLSILVGCARVFVNHDHILEKLRSRDLTVGNYRCSVYVLIAVAVVFAAAWLMIYYFFYDIAVYITLALYFVIGVAAIWNTLSFWIMHFCIPARKTFSYDYQLWTWHLHGTFAITSIFTFCVGIAIMTTWAIFRKNENIGWPLQSAIGVVLIGYAISSTIPLPSLKMLTVLFTAFVMYDVFFVFVTPYFTQTDLTPASSAAVIRNKRSIPERESYMEAVATGSAGTNGEIIPLCFRLSVPTSSGQYNCVDSIHGSSLLGYGDALLPGFLIAFVALFDSIWKIRFKRNVLGSIAGFIVGLLVSSVAMRLMQRGQPALLYLCPCVLLATIFSSGTFGGLEELRNLWTGCFLSSDTQIYPEFDVGAVEQKDELCAMDVSLVTLTVPDGDADRHNGTNSRTELVSSA